MDDRPSDEDRDAMPARRDDAATRELASELDRVCGPGGRCAFWTCLFDADAARVLRALPDGAGLKAAEARLREAEAERGLGHPPWDGPGAVALLLVRPVVGDGDHARITALLGLEPTVRRADVWVLGTRGRVASGDPGEHLAALLALLRPRLGAMRRLSRYREVEVFVRLPRGTARPYPRYQEFLAAVRALGAGLDFEATQGYSTTPAA